MIIAALSVLLLAVVVAAGLGLLSAGEREGDRPGDVTVTGVRADAAAAAISLVVHNPGVRPVIVGASLRRRGPRMRVEGRMYVTVPRDTTRDALLASRHTALTALEPKESRTLVVSAQAPIRRSAEVVIAVGQSDRLRVIHRAVELVSVAPTPPDAVVRDDLPAVR